MDAKPIIVSLEALRTYHSIDRALYAILVTELWRDPVESLQIIALWLWLERVGFGKVTRKILASAQLFINQTAEEAIMCLKCIKDSRFIYSAEAADIPMTRSIIEKEISLRFFNENRVTASREVDRIINQDCLRTMRDITAKALHGNAGESSSRKQMMVPFNVSRHSLSKPIVMPSNGGQSSAYNLMLIPLNANAAESSSINQIRIPSLSNPIVMPSNDRRRLGLKEMMVSCHFDDSVIHDLSNMRIGRNTFTRNDRVINEVPPEDRTMFATFSRGYPVAEMEVRHFFATFYGICIESFRMQEVRPYEQPLYARVVFSKASFVQEILDGEEKAKFTINGKHVWMRKFVPQNEDSS